MKIHRIRGLGTSSYLIEDEALFMVDGGFVGHAPFVLNKIRALGRRPDELKMVIVTHHHVDHYGGLAELARFCRFDVACHPGSARGVRTGGKHISPGHVRWAKAFVAVATASLPHVTFKGVPPTIILSDGDRLDEYGLPCTVLHTPGHTDGCVSLVLDDGSALTGDLVMGKGGWHWLPRQPAMAMNLERTHDSWRKLLAAGTKRILPAHAGRFSIGEMTSLMRRCGLPRWSS